MRKGLSNPNTVQALKDLKMEIASELGISDIESIEHDINNKNNQQINKMLTERSRNNLIGFK